MKATSFKSESASSEGTGRNNSSTRRSLTLLALLFALTGCATTFTDTTKLPCTISHELEGNELTVRATIQNLSDSAVTFVDHPDFYSISVLAVDRTKDEASPQPTIHFVRATKDNLVVVPPNESITFEGTFEFRRRSKEVVEVHYGPTYMRIWDDHLQATFNYGTSPDYLPKHAWLLSKNYVMAEISAREVFPTP